MPMCNCVTPLALLSASFVPAALARPIADDKPADKPGDKPLPTIAKKIGDSTPLRGLLDCEVDVDQGAVATHDQVEGDEADR